MVLYGSAWLCMVLYGAVWLCMVPYSIMLHTLYNITDIRVFTAVLTRYRSYRASRILEICE